MKRPLRAVAYGFLIWWLWFAVIGISQTLPDSVRSEQSFAMLRLVVLVVLVVMLAVDYLRRVQRSNAFEGLLVGLTWMALMVANDFGHFVAMNVSFDLGVYLVASAPLYSFIPITTVALFAGLMTSSLATTNERGG